jgi:hypothetical protein
MLSSKNFKNGTLKINTCAAWNAHDAQGSGQRGSVGILEITDRSSTRESAMILASRQFLSRRGFCLCCIGSATFAATGGWLSPSQVFAEAREVVDLIRSEAAKAPIKVHKLRSNVSVLEGSGGNVAVLTGPDGKLLVDAGITASRPRIVEALASLSSRPNQAPGQHPLAL